MKRNEHTKFYKVQQIDYSSGIAAGDHFTIFEKVTIIGNFSITPSQKVLIKEPPPKFN